MTLTDYLALAGDDGLYFVTGDDPPTVYRLDSQVGLPDMTERDRAVARALALLAVERLERVP